MSALKILTGFALLIACALFMGGVAVGVVDYPYETAANFVWQEPAMAATMLSALPCALFALRSPRFGLELLLCLTLFALAMPFTIMDNMRPETIHELLDTLPFIALPMLVIASVFAVRANQAQRA